MPCLSAFSQRVTRMWSSWSIILFRLPLRSWMHQCQWCIAYDFSFVSQGWHLRNKLYLLMRSTNSLCSPVKEYTHRIGRTGRAGKKGGAMLQGQPAVFDQIFPWVEQMKSNEIYTNFLEFLMFADRPCHLLFLPRLQRSTGWEGSHRFAAAFLD